MGDLHITANLGGEIPFDVQSFAVGDERRLRSDMEASNVAAKHVWNELEQRQRDALVSLVAESLTELAGSVEQWLEGSLVAKSNEKIGVFLLFRLGNLDDQIIRLRSINEAERLDRIADLARIARGPVSTPS